MESKTKIIIYIACAVAFVFSLVVFIIEVCGHTGLRDKLIFNYDYIGENKIIFTNVGDANCTILKSGNEVAVFSFGGVLDGGNSLIKAIRKYQITTVDYAFVNITDENHLGGFMVLNNLTTINNVVSPSINDYEFNNTPTALAAKETILSLNHEFVNLNKNYKVGNFTVTPIYYSKNALSSEGRAVIYKVTFGEYSAIIGGNFSQDIMFENYINNELPTADILLLPGFSDNSHWNLSFFDDIKVKYVVSSSDYKNNLFIQNDYKLLQEKFNLYRTDVDGDITFYFNEKISVSTEKKAA